MKNVKFLPWVGKNYQYGILGHDDHGLCYGNEKCVGKKLLILGESHYSHEENPNLTNEVISKICNPHEKLSFRSTYTKFERALTGKVLDFSQHTELWETLMFYNFVQTLMPAPRVRPAKKDFKASEPAFQEVLKKYSPDYIISWGYKLYDCLPQTGHQLQNIVAEDGKEAAVWGYEVGVNTIPLLAIKHPASAFSPSHWHIVIRKFLQDY